MKYETPKLTALTSAINAIQSDVDAIPKMTGSYELDNVYFQEHFTPGYMDWED